MVRSIIQIMEVINNQEHNQYYKAIKNK